ncbi:MAG: apolipoprotein N-acyltransferase [Deltaproteobacteria bacterium]|nr:apolipoprotein N-acyltransferase [Deltaproteobacteria bacterium]
MAWAVSEMSMALMRDLFLALLSAGLLALSFPSFDHGLPAWIALVPLLTVIQAGSPGRAAWFSLASGIAFFMGIFFWINGIDGFTPLDFIVLGIYLGSYFAVFGMLLRFVTERTPFPALVTAPVLWVSFEYVRSHMGFLGLPWGLLGHSQYRNLPLIQIASITGVYGISFLIVMVNTALADLLGRLKVSENGDRRLTPGRVGQVIFVVLLSVGVYLHGWMAITAQDQSRKINLTVVQGNIPQALKWDSGLMHRHLDRHARLTLDACLNASADLIVWPETSVPGLFGKDLYFSSTISDLARQTQTHILFGSAQRPKFGPGELRNEHRLNSAYLISPAGTILKRYDKIRLLPFAEYLPYGDDLPWPKRFVTATGNFLPGKDYTVFSIMDVPFGVTICWENIFAKHFRQFVRNGAQFMVNITNEAWFGDTAAPYQFLAMSVFRAVENRVPLVRCANTGISCFIGPHGGLVGKVTNGGKELFVEGHLTRSIPISPHKTFYTVHGDVFALVCLAASMLLLAFSIFIRNSCTDDR